MLASFSTCDSIMDNRETLSVPAQRRRLGILAPLKSWGGIERKMLILCREFLSMGIQPVLLRTRGGQIPYPDEFPQEVDVVDLDSRGKLDAIPRLIRYLRRDRLDALLTAKDHAAKVAVLAVNFGRIDTPVFVKVTNTLSMTLRRPLKRRFAKWLYPRADRIIAISQGVKQDLVEQFGMPPGKIEVIYNPMVTRDFEERARRCPEHSWLGPEQPPVFLGAGRLSGQKDFVTLVEAFAQVRSRIPCRLIILGEGEQRPLIEARALQLNVRDDVDLPGYVSDPLPWMAAADAFVLSSRYEGLGNVLVEAMAVGTTLVSTDCPSGPSEILEGGRLGRLSPVGHPRRLAEGMLQAVEHPIDPNVLRAGAARFESNAIARRYLNLMGLL